MDLPLVWAHDGTLYMAKKEVAKLGWESDSQSSKKLKLKVVKAGYIGLNLGCGGHALGYAPLDDPKNKIQRRRPLHKFLQQTLRKPFCSPLDWAEEGSPVGHAIAGIVLVGMATHSICLKPPPLQLLIFIPGCVSMQIWCICNFCLLQSMQTKCSRC